MLPNRYGWCSLALRQAEVGTVEAVLNRIDHGTRKIVTAQVGLLMGDLSDPLERAELLLAAAGLVFSNAAEDAASETPAGG